MGVLLHIVVIHLLIGWITSENSLRKVIVITRHGDRSPTRNYPNLHQWPILGELTGEGMAQMHHLGTQLRERYIQNHQFLPSSYHLFERSHLYVRSTDKDRTLMSAHSLLLGFYPPGTGPNRAIGESMGDETGLPYGIQVIPIHSESAKNDYLLYGYKNCFNLKKLMKDFKNTEMWLAKEEETLQFRSKLANLLGTEEISLGDMSAVYHAIKAEKIHAKSDISTLGLTEEEFNKIMELKDWVLHRKYWDREMGKLGSGFLLHTIVKALNDAAEELLNDNTDPEAIDPIFTYYSGHDGTLLSLFSAMGLQGNFDIPHYSSHVIFELHQQGTQFEVVVEYNHKSLLPDCPKGSCPLSKFTSLMEEGTIPSILHKTFLCGPPNTTTHSPVLLHALTLLMAGLLLFGLSKVSSLCTKKEKES